MSAVTADDFVFEAEEAAPPTSRMAIAVLALLGVFVSGYLSLYKLGIISTLICQVGSCDRVQNSPWSYLLGLPVAVWGVGAYLTILAVAFLGVQPRFARRAWVGRALFGLALVGFVFSAYLTYLEAAVIHAWCQWCVVSAILITIIFLLSISGLKRPARGG